jgi:zinc D-Ala-D-Ala carboxypeptidase
MNLTKHFTLPEMLVSHTAYYLKIKEQMNPPQEVVSNLTALCKEVLEPVRELSGPLLVNSGYRCLALNKAVKGSTTSQHMTGEAADITVGSRSANKILYETIKKSGIVFDQMIWEYGDEKGPDWVHISYKAKGKNRMQTIRIR